MTKPFLMLLHPVLFLHKHIWLLLPWFSCTEQKRRDSWNGGGQQWQVHHGGLRGCGFVQTLYRVLCRAGRHFSRLVQLSHIFPNSQTLRWKVTNDISDGCVAAILFNIVSPLKKWPELYFSKDERNTFKYMMTGCIIYSQIWSGL